MNGTYNRVAGQSPERIAALSDGLFAIAMTLLVLDIHIPEIAGIHGEADLVRALAGLAPHFLIYLMSFLTLGIFWVGQQTQLNHFARADRNLAWLHIAFLAVVALVPFSTALLAAYVTFRTALIVYWFNVLMLGVMLFLSWRYARRAELIVVSAPADIDSAVVRRIVIAQSLYLFGAALCAIGTYWSIAFIALVQLNYALAPLAWMRRRG